MTFTLRKASLSELQVAFELLKHAAERLNAKGLKQWGYWMNPPQEKIAWVEEGFKNGEFFFILIDDHIAGMYRLLTEDKLYWGAQETSAWYIHSLVVKTGYTGKGIGEQVILRVKEDCMKLNIQYLRLDCDAENVGLCNYYEQQGFKIVGQKQMPLSLNNLYELTV
jgi:ribosomal protein S18 acetylase RimI-like enzyme